MTAQELKEQEGLRLIRILVSKGLSLQEIKSLSYQPIQNFVMDIGRLAVIAALEKYY